MTEFRRFRGTDSYLTNDALEAAVNCALALERPLLVKGEPGTGKTLLAEAIAEGLQAELITWNVKSTTRAQDGLYVYDTVQRLYDSRFGDGDVRDIRRYINLGPLGRRRRARHPPLHQPRPARPSPERADARGPPDRRGRQGRSRVPQRSPPR